MNFRLCLLLVLTAQSDGDTRPAWYRLCFEQSTEFTTWEVNMQSLKKRFSLIAAAISLAGILASIGCNTVRGMGRDIERGGEKTQDAAESVQRRL